ncbi:hypothetical protein ACLBKU_08860 [Erythrobacter sp. NE805]|uniref:hypothetical protein n=1 Tax=Erythrobacter sp. NE805 TaxID=3389875 RepID=UPI00396AFC45
MTALPPRFLEDRELRDKARAVLAEDIARLQDNLGEEGIASRVSSGVTSSITGRIRSGARDVLEQAKAQAADSKGVLALLVGAFLMWLAREPIFAWFQDLRDELAQPDLDPTDDAAPPEAAPSGDPE